MEKSLNKHLFLGMSAAALLCVGATSLNGNTVHAAEATSTQASTTKQDEKTNAKTQNNKTVTETKENKEADQSVDTSKGNPNVDYTKLDAAIKDAQDAHKETGFTKSTKKEKEAFVDALNKAKDVRETADGTQAQADNIAELLTKRMNELSGRKLKSANKANLTDALEKAKAVKDTDAYKKDTDENKQLFDKMITAAEGINKNEDATQTDVDTAANAINRAVEQLNRNQTIRDKQATERAKKIKESYPDQQPVNSKDGKDGKDGRDATGQTAKDNQNGEAQNGQDTKSYPKQKDTASYPDEASYPARLPQTGEANANALGVVGVALASLASLVGSGVVTKKFVK